MPKAVPLRVKTTSLPITLQGSIAGEGDWRIVADTPRELRMQRVDVDGTVIATLVASAPPAVLPRAA